MVWTAGVIGSFRLETTPTAAFVEVTRCARHRVWSAFRHQQIAAVAGKDAIVTGWADWGWAGASTFAYVITDARSNSSSPAGAEAWRQRLKLDCPVTSSQRIWGNLYLVETTDCPFDGIALPE